MLRCVNWQIVADVSDDPAVSIFSHPAYCSVGNRVKLLGHEAGNSLSSSAKVKNAWSCSLRPICIRGVAHRDNFTLPYGIEVDSMGVISTVN
jgi:hypothetical protein